MTFVAHGGKRETKVLEKKPLQTTRLEIDLPRVIYIVEGHQAQIQRYSVSGS